MKTFFKCFMHLCRAVCSMHESPEHNVLCVCLLEQAVPCYSIVQCTPCYAGVHWLHALPGCLHVACSLHACFQCTRKLHILPVCNHSMFWLDASMLPVASIHVFRCTRKTPYFASVQSLYVLPGCFHAACCLRACFLMYKKNSIFCHCPLCNHSIFCLDAITTCIADCGFIVLSR